MSDFFLLILSSESSTEDILGQIRLCRHSLHYLLLNQHTALMDLYYVYTILKRKVVISYCLFFFVYPRQDRLVGWSFFFFCIVFLFFFFVDPRKDKMDGWMDEWILTLSLNLTKICLFANGVIIMNLKIFENKL